jgi:rubrerythrin
MSPGSRKTTARKAAGTTAAKAKAAGTRTGAAKVTKGPPAGRRPAGKKAAAVRKRAPATGKAVAAPRSVEEFMREALAMELEAAQRYDEFADAMEIHNNLEVAALFRKMAGIEGLHARQIMAEMGWTRAPAPQAAIAPWEGFEAPETAPGDEVHYLMQPYHALTLALANEQRAERFFARLARAAGSAAVRKAARELQKEEREHVELVRAWMKKVPQPDADWANDPDPPAYTD